MANIDQMQAIVRYTLSEDQREHMSSVLSALEQVIGESESAHE